MNKLANKRTSKRGQMEIMGLAVVVILVIVGITLLIRFSLTPAKQTKEKFEAGQLPETIITALAQSTTDCQEQSMANLIEDCGAFGGTIQCEPGKNSCQYTQESINGVLVELLERMLKYKYKVILKKGGREDFNPEDLNDPAKIYLDSGCDESMMDIESASQPLPNNVEIELRICKGRIG
ncbi:MAG: hypothetical protein QT07_C0007G0025 [archaeon GW2011_AR16]|nr:MAG: hypothetical protein QT07_C0007G0025 [archaeon GW2011_AR16]